VAADLGTAVVLVGTAAAVFYVAGLERRYFLRAMVAMGIVLSIAILMKPYRIARLITYLDPEYKVLRLVDPEKKILAYAQRSGGGRDNGYQTRQSVLAVGSGGPLGRGLGRGKQKLLYLPEAHNDFIYAVVAEEWGLLGTLGLLGAFVFILIRGFRLYWLAADDFGRYLAVGVTTSVVLQALIHMSVVVDLVPNKGIPLPLISYGGSAMLGTLISFGLLLSVSERAG